MDRNSTRSLVVPALGGIAFILMGAFLAANAQTLSPASQVADKDSYRGPIDRLGGVDRTLIRWRMPSVPHNYPSFNGGAMRGFGGGHNLGGSPVGGRGFGGGQGFGGGGGHGHR